jgi:hypothetical protein
MNLISYYIVPDLTICDIVAIFKKYFPLQGLMKISFKDNLNPNNINNAKLICRFLKQANAIRNEDINTG